MVRYEVQALRTNWSLTACRALVFSTIVTHIECGVVIHGGHSCTAWVWAYVNRAFTLIIFLMVRTIISMKTGKFR